ncbi:MAG: hypothetical protein AB7Y46_11270 [Armatimonadota bacterium]
MLYPDPDGPGPPLPCLRLKLMKKGIDDFKYLAMLETALAHKYQAEGRADAAEAARARTRDLAATLALDVGSYETDMIALERARLQIAEELEATLAALDR